MMILLLHLRTFLTLIYNQMVGERNMRLISVDNNSEEVYRLETNNGGLVVLYCSEVIYELSFTRWWQRDQRHYAYKVHGLCNPLVPEDLSDRLALGLTLGRLLPAFAPRHFQKKAAIHAYVSLVLSELRTRDQ